jgi:photosystem II stability/assembly factor-like uncharacterized protein
MWLALLVLTALLLCVDCANAEPRSDEIQGYEAVRPAQLKSVSPRPVFTSIRRLRSLHGGQLIVLMHLGALLRFDQEGKVSSRQNPPGEWFNDFSTSEDGRTLWLVGQRGRVEVSTDSGLNWRSVDVALGEDLNHVESSKDGRQIWILSNSGKVIRSLDSGATWVPVTPVPATPISAIRYIDSTGTLVVSGRGVVGTTSASATVVQLTKCDIAANKLRGIAASPNGQQLIAVGDSGRLCRSADSGRTWVAMKATGPGNQLLDAVYEPSSNNFVLFGDEGTVLEPNGRTAWKSIDLPLVDESLNSAAVLDVSGRLVVGGDGGLILVRDAKGGEWTHWSDPSWENQGFEAAATDSSGRIVVAVGDKGETTITEDGGLSTYVVRISDTALQAAAVSDSGSVRIVGDSQGGLYRWSTARRDWTKLDSNIDESIYSLALSPDGALCVVATNSGSLWLIENGHERNVARIDGESFYEVTRNSRGDLYVAGGSGGQVLISRDSAHTWTLKALPNKEGAASVHATELGEIYVGTTNGKIYYASSPTEAWRLLPIQGSEKIRAITVYDNAIWWAVGGRLMRSLDKGLSSANEFSLRGNVSLLGAGLARLWFATESHELGFVEPSKEEYPRVLSWEPLERLKRRGNRLVVNFSSSQLCPAEKLQIELRVGPEDGLLEPVKLTESAVLGEGRRQLTFDIPQDVPEEESSLRMYTTCPGQFIYAYTLHSLSFKSLGDRIPGGWSTISTVAFALIFPIVAILLYFVSPSRLLRLRDHIDQPGLPQTIQFVLRALDAVLLTGFLCRRPKVLDAWVTSVRARTTPYLLGRASLKRSTSYLPLPIVVVFGRAPAQEVVEPTAGAVRRAFASHLSKASSIQIVGVGGIGKTTFAVCLCQWIAEEDVLGHPAVAVLMQKFEGLLADNVFATLSLAVPNAPPSRLLIRDLLATRRLVPFFDRVSELDDSDRAKVVDLAQQASLCLITAREEQPLDGSPLLVRPSFLTTATSITRYVEYELGSTTSVKPEGLALEAGKVAYHLIATFREEPQAADGRPSGIAITPLLAKTFAALAAETLSAGGDLGELPRSAVRVYVDHVRSAFATGDSHLVGINEDVFLLATASLAGTAFARGAGPSPIDRDSAKAICGEFVGAAQASALVSAMVTAGILKESRRSGRTFVSFMIDPYAEALAAWYIKTGGSNAVALGTALRDVSASSPSNASVRQVIQYLEDLLA